MTIKALRRTAGLFLLLTAAAAQAQSSTTKVATPFDRFIAHFDLSASGKGEFNTTSTGNNYLPQSVSLQPSNTLGALVTLRYTAKPYIGLEYNYTYARYTDNFTITNIAGTPAGSSPLVLGVQTNATEYSFGYVVHFPHHYYGIVPVASAGAGTTAFRPTKGGGQGLLVQARASYYANIGVEAPAYGDHFGLRAGFRAVSYKAPDYESNYFRNQQRAISSEPYFGFYLRY